MVEGVPKNAVVDFEVLSVATISVSKNSVEFEGFRVTMRKKEQRWRKIFHNEEKTNTRKVNTMRTRTMKRLVRIEKMKMMKRGRDSKEWRRWKLESGGKAIRNNSTKR